MAQLRLWEADLKKLLQAFAACGKPKVQLQELQAALSQQFPKTRLHGDEAHGLKLGKELLIFDRVFQQEKSRISLVRPIQEEELPAILRDSGLLSNTPMKQLLLQKETGAGALLPYTLSPQYPVIIAQSASDVDKWVDDIYSRRVKLLGFDTESPPVFRAGQTSSLALLQFATTRSCLLVHIPKLGSLPLSLVRLLEDGSVAKAGFGVLNDFALLKNQYQVTSRSALDISHACKGLGLRSEEQTNWGVQTCAAILLSQFVEKSRKVTCSNWAQQPLTTRQVAYAAMDAVTSLNCALQALLLRPGAVLSGLCTLATDHTLALAAGQSTLVVALFSEQGSCELRISVIKHPAGPMQVYSLVDTAKVRVHTAAQAEALRALGACTDPLQAEQLAQRLAGSPLFQSQFLSVYRVPVGLG